ncbi:MAG: hypothetical protein ACR2O4_03615 [Hyphomicrobiaceae bacterium]
MKTVPPRLAIYLPAILGLGFPLIVKLNHKLFFMGLASARTAIAIEAIYLLASMLAIVLATHAVFRAPRSRLALYFLLLAISIGFWGFGIVMGFERGAAIVTAT